jgi:hypothetical protein
MLTSLVFAIHNLRRGHQSVEDQELTGLGRAAASPSQTSLMAGYSSPTAGFLIANPRLEFELSSNDPSQLQISNRERMAICRFTRSSCPPRFRLSQTSCDSSRRSVFLIVTPRLEFPATPTKQNSNAISNRYKTPFFAPLSRSSPITRLPLRRPRADEGSLLPQPPGKL